MVNAVCPPDGGAPAGCDLDRHLVPGPHDLGMHIAAVEFRHQGMCDVIGLDVAVKNSSFHVFNYQDFVIIQRVPENTVRV